MMLVSSPIRKGDSMAGRLVDAHKHKWSYAAMMGAALEVGYKQCQVCGVITDPLGGLYRAVETDNPERIINWIRIQEGKA